MHASIRALVDRLNPLCRKALESAAGLCVSKTHATVQLEHFLIKLIENPESDMQQILRHYELDPQVLLKQLYAHLDKLPQGFTTTPALSEHIFKALEEAWLYASLTLHEETTRSACILMAIVDHDTLRGLVLETCPLLLRLSRHAFREDLPELLGELPETAIATIHPPSKFLSPDTQEGLQRYTQDLTMLARQNKLDPIFGRDQEIRQTIDILTRRRQNNPLLVGEPGVGKTAIAEGLAQRIAQKQVPPLLQDTVVLSLDLLALQAGASVRGQFEERLNTVLNEIKKAPHPVILFVDEAHTLIGSGGTAGLGDAANLLKPALARGEIRVLGATTWTEYKKHIEKDGALSRRFELVKIKEPSAAEALPMVRAFAKTLSQHHQVTILESALEMAVRLSKRYLIDRQLPDKAIRLLDTAAAHVVLARSTMPETLQQLKGQESLLSLEQSMLTPQHHRPEVAQRLSDISSELAHIEKTYEVLEKTWEGQKQILNRYIETQDSTERQALEDELTQQGIPFAVDHKILAKIVSESTGIPLDIILTTQETWRFDELVVALKTYIVGQSHALSTIARQIINYQAGLTDPHKPMGVFLLAGPSGVGKTETAQALATLLTGSSEQLIRLNMTEFQEAHSIATLKGSPPGYVGYGQGGVLTEAVRRNPYAVIVLDEFDKAHRDVIDLFYQVFDKGRLEDAEGIELDFSNTLILLTTNLCDEQIIHALEESPTIDMLALTQKIMPELSRFLRSALLARMTVIPYLPLSRQEMKQIVHLKLSQLKHRVEQQHHITLNYDDKTLEHFVERTHQSRMTGARAIDYWINQELLPELASLLLEKNNHQGQPIVLNISHDGLCQPRFLSNVAAA